MGRRGALRTSSVSAGGRRLRRAIRTYGVGGTIRHAWTAVRTSGQTRRALDEERAFDREFGVDTSGIVRLENLSIGGENRSFGVRYQGSDPSVVRRTISGLPIAPEEFVFVDFGSGKGRVILVASEFPFKRIVGVEFSPELHAVAERNIATYSNPARRSSAVESVCVDAAAYELPDEPLVLWFYNPFLEPVMRAVLERIDESLRRNPRPTYVVYTGTVPMAPLIEQAGFRRIESQLVGTDGVFSHNGRAARDPENGG